MLGTNALPLPRVNWTEYPTIALSAWANRSLLFLGDSTLRSMVTDMIQQVTWTGADRLASGYAQVATAVQCPSEWDVTIFNCSESMGYGCVDCVGCCCGRPTCPQRNNTAISEIVRDKTRAREWIRLTNGWSDFTARCTSLNLSLSFSWKPELYTQADVRAFETRFCLRPPDVLLVGKGLHDAVRRYEPTDLTLSEFENTFEAAFRRFATLLRCLPPTTLIVVRTATATDLLAATNRLTFKVRKPIRLTSEHEIVMRLYADGVFRHPSVILDAFQLTNASHVRRMQGNAIASTHKGPHGESLWQDPDTPPSAHDGIHYPPMVQLWLWRYLEVLWSRREREG